ncbi:MAG TPA: hypothetical protein VMI33_07720 [Streptosporangiaceae bacterium]|nr:hypothetical protein [Streptosporangiaceae bacterium]
MRYPQPGDPDERRRRFEQVYTANVGPAAYMGYMDVVVRAHTSAGLDGTAHFRRGQILGWEALLRSGIVSRPGQIP